MNRARRATLTVFLVVVGIAILIVVRAHYVADLSAFLPQSPSPAQQLLVQQLQDGPASRLILVGIDGTDAQHRAEISHGLASTLRGYPQFRLVSNGESGASEADQRFVFEHRYVLSDGITPERFSVDGLESAIGDSLQTMTGSMGLSGAELFEVDPTGETMQVVDQLGGGTQPARTGGVWSSKDGRRALLLLQTAASGSDTDAQEQTLRMVESAWRSLNPVGLSLLLSSPGKFAVDARATIKREATRLSVLSCVLIILLLLWAYRSVPAVLLGLLPVACGALAGIAAVQLGFGLVHGITLGFGVTLIGESVDYSVYLLVQGRGGNGGSLWPTIVLGALTSICGFASLLPSTFPGLAQLGLFSIAGLVAAALVTRFVLPMLLPPALRMANLTRFGIAIARGFARTTPPAALAKTLALGLSLVCLIVLWSARERLWNRDIAALSPVPESARLLDTELRAQMGAPDIGSLIVVSAAEEQAVLRASEAIGQQLDALVTDGVIASYDSPAHYLPSERMQRSRQASLPDAATLRQRIDHVSNTLGLKPGALEPFERQVATARTDAPLTSTTLQGTSFALGLSGLLWQHDGAWHAILPLRAQLTGSRAGDVNLTRIREALASVPTGELRGDGAQWLVMNIKQETDSLYGSYLNAALRLSAYGVAAIVLLLLVALRDVVRVVRVLSALVLGVLCVAAALALARVQLTILHLVGMLLIVAVGSNYALFFDRRAADQDGAALPLTLASLTLANLCTVTGFGVLAFSSVPVLQALGMTVAPGTLLALYFSAALAPRRLWIYEPRWN